MKRRFGLRAFAGLTALAAAAVVALMVAGGSVAATETTFADVPYVSLGTDLHASQVGASSATFTNECDGSENLTGTQVLWHFVLVQTTAQNTAVLRAEFANAKVTVPDVVKAKYVGGVIHWNVITPSSDVLLNASTDAAGAILNLSHVCGGDGGSGGQTSDISTTVHLGATDPVTDPATPPTVVDNANPAALGSTVHDSANLTFSGGGNLPAGSIVYFSFYNTNDCSSDPVDSGHVNVSGASPVGGLDPVLAEGPLGAGGYSYAASFVSGNSSLVADALGDCEPFMISKGTPTTATAIHVGQTDTGAPVVVPTAGIDPGGYVHDSATVTGITGFPPTGTVTFTWFTNGACDVGATAATGVAAGTIQLVAGVADPSTAEGPLAPGDYSFQASYSSDGNYTAGDPSGCEPLHVFNAALTPGYWKNHLTFDSKHPTAPYTGHFLTICLGGTWNGTDCTGGYLSGGVHQYAVKTTANATSVFNAMNCSNTGSNSSQNQNAVGCLAGHLLAAKLNVADGANTCIATAIITADGLLSADHYIGPTNSSYTGITDRAALIAVKNTLDKYNNGGGC
jgi:hypothetical protein